MTEPTQPSTAINDRDRCRLIEASGMAGELSGELAMACGRALGQDDYARWWQLSQWALAVMKIESRIDGVLLAPRDDGS